MSLWKSSKRLRTEIFQGADFAGNLTGSTSTSGGVLCVLESLTLVPISWACKKKTAVSLGSTHGRHFGIEFVGHNHRYFAPTSWEVSPSPLFKLKYQNVLIQLETSTTYTRMRDYSARELHDAFTRDRWTRLAPLAKIRKHTTFNQSNLSVSSAVVNPLFSSMSKRAEEYFAASVRTSLDVSRGTARTPSK